MKPLTETHPLLKGLRMQPDNQEAGDMYLCEDGEYLQCCDVQEKTIDKAVLKEVINKARLEGGVYVYLDMLLEELGLEEE